jgi:hypothetical protein
VSYLQEGGVVGITASVDVKAPVIVNDGDTKIRLSPGWVRLAAISGVPLLPLLLELRPFGSATLHLGPLISTEELKNATSEEICTYAGRFFLPILKRQPAQMQPTFISQILAASA